MKKKALLDSYALLCYLKKENNWKAVKAALSSGEISCFLNELNAGEVYYILARNRGAAQADYFLDVILPSLPLKIISNNFDLIIKASRLKAKHPISYMDCFAAATAAQEKAVLLTGDPEFKKVENLIEIEWL